MCLLNLEKLIDPVKPTIYMLTSSGHARDYLATVETQRIGGVPWRKNSGST